MALLSPRLSHLHSLRQACDRANDEACARLSRELRGSERSALSALTPRVGERSETPARARELEEEEAAEAEARPAPAPALRDGGGGGAADRARARGEPPRFALRAPPPRPAAVPEWLRGPCLAAALGCADWGRREAPPASALAALGPEPWRIAERWRGRLAEARRRWGDSLAKSKDQLEVDLAREFEAAVLALRAAELPIPQKRGALAKGVRRRESLVQLFLDVLPPLLRRVAGASRGLHRGHVP